MKRIVLALVVFFSGLSVYALELEGGVGFDYLLKPSEISLFPVNGEKTSNGLSDKIRLDFTTNTVAYASNAPHPEPVPASDPYLVKYNGYDYIMFCENNDRVWDENDILGFHDKITDLFKSLKALDDDKNGKITQQELRSHKIRFVRVSKEGKALVKKKQDDLNLSEIDYLDIKNKKVFTNSSSVGIHGHFYVHLKNKQQVVGYVISAQNEVLGSLF